MTTPFPDDTTGLPTDGLSAEEQRVADHRDLTPAERLTRQDYVGSGNDARSSAPHAEGQTTQDGTEGADPAQRPMEGTSEEFPVAEGVRTHVQLDEPVRSHGASDAGSPAASAGTVPDGMNESTQTDNPYPATTWERPVTGVHRPAAPEGEVAAE